MKNWLSIASAKVTALRDDEYFKDAVLATVAAIVMVTAFQTSIGVHFEIGVSEINARSALSWWILQLVSTAIWIAISTLAWLGVHNIPYLRRSPKWLTGLLCFWLIWYFTTGHFLFDPNYQPLSGSIVATAPLIDILSMFIFRVVAPFIIWMALVGSVLNPVGWGKWRTRVTKSRRRKRLTLTIVAGLLGAFATATRVPVSSEVVATKWRSALIEPALVGGNSTADIIFDDKNMDAPVTSDLDVYWLGEMGNSKSGRQSNEIVLDQARPIIEFLAKNQALVYIIELEKMPDGVELSRVIEKLPATELAGRFSKIVSGCNIQIDQSFHYRRNHTQAISLFEQEVVGQSAATVSVSPLRHPGLFVAPLQNQLRDFGVGFSSTGATWKFLSNSRSQFGQDWPFETGDGSTTGFSSSQPVRVFVEKSYLELGFGPFCGNSLRKNPEKSFFFTKSRPTVRVLANLPKSGHFDVPSETAIHLPVKFWVQPYRGSAGTFQSESIDGQIIVNGEAHELRSGTSVRVTNLTSMNSSGERARMHARSSDVAIGEFMASKRLVVFFSWEYWSAVAALILCYFGWNEYVRRRKSEGQ